MAELSDMSNEDLQKEHARVMVVLEGLQEQMEELMALGDEEGGVDPEELHERVQEKSRELRALEQELHQRGLGS
jgi:hypothetical protein